MAAQLHRSGQGNNAPDQNQKRYRNFCFTSFEEEPPVFNEKMSYICYSPEVCPTTGKKHWQGYIYFKNPCTISAIQKRGYKYSYLAPARGSSEQNRIYCGADAYVKDGKRKEKNDNFVEYGLIPKQGERNDIKDVVDMVLRNETTVNEIIVNQPMLYHQYGRTFEKAEDIKLQSMFRTWETTGEWHYGATGTGKSQYAFENYSPDTHYLLIDDNGWWDGYKGQDIVIINDFRGWIPYDMLLNLLDRYPMTVKRRGRCPAPFMSKKIIITSSLHPSEVYCNRHVNDSLEQLLRRLKIIPHIKIGPDEKGKKKCKKVSINDDRFD